ncbi:MAG: hypothetical protein GC151_00970 [Betaproteobacteria bacterium]|nr:hypothetical protein [Betaproteobacteria bacterium]
MTITRPSHFARRVLPALVSAVVLSGVVTSAFAHDRDRDDDADRYDPVVLRFSTVGDSRQDPKHPDPTTMPVPGQDQNWLQNTKALARILETVNAQKSKLLFFNGDMIMGYGKASSPASTSVADVVGSDLMAFYKQYAYWRGMVAPTIESGTYIVPVPGNHEVQCKACGKAAQVENENAWRANMGDIILDTTRLEAVVGPNVANVDVADHKDDDALTTDQSQLSYSFDVDNVHFAVINTDAVGYDNHAPIGWLTKDLDAAKRRGVGNIFVFGHKPAYTYYYDAAGDPGVSGIDKDAAKRDEFWNLIESYGATYFCGHEHIFNMRQPTAGIGGHAWQVIVGAGGSPFEVAPGTTTFSPSTDRAYSWATVSVHRSGAADIAAYGFDDSFGRTRLLKRVHVPATR